MIRWLIHRGLCTIAAAMLLCTSQASAQIPADQLYDQAVAFIRAGNLDNADSLLRIALRTDARHDKAYELLWAIHAKRGLPTDPAMASQLSREFPEGSFLRTTPYYLILYDAAHPWADTRARMLETARANFYKTLRADGFRPTPPQHKLVCILFNQHEDFQNYANSVDHLNRSWSGGYYSSRTNRVALFNYHTSPQLKDLVLQMRKLESQVQSALGAAATSPQARGKLGSIQQELATVKRRYETIASYGNIRQTLHEAAHQLAYNSNIQNPTLTYPMWFSEGLATCFEAINPAVPFGPTLGNFSRSHDLLEARRAGQLETLDQFVRRATPPDHEDDINAAYAHSWALFHFLYNQRLPQLRAFVADMNAQPPGPRNADQLHAHFIKHFGPIENIQPAFDAYVRKLEP